MRTLKLTKVFLLFFKIEIRVYRVGVILFYLGLCYCIFYCILFYLSLVYLFWFGVCILYCINWGKRFLKAFQTRGYHFMSTIVRFWLILSYFVHVASIWSMPGQLHNTTVPLIFPNNCPFIFSTIIGYKNTPYNIRFTFRVKQVGIYFEFII